MATPLKLGLLSAAASVGLAAAILSAPANGHPRDADDEGGPPPEAYAGAPAYYNTPAPPPPADRDGDRYGPAPVQGGYEQHWERQGGYAGGGSSGSVTESGNYSSRTSKSVQTYGYDSGWRPVAPGHMDGHQAWGHGEGHEAWGHDEGREAGGHGEGHEAWGHGEGHEGWGHGEGGQAWGHAEEHEGWAAGERREEAERGEWKGEGARMGGHPEHWSQGWSRPGQGHTYHYAEGWGGRYGVSPGAGRSYGHMTVDKYAYDTGWRYSNGQAAPPPPEDADVSVHLSDGFFEGGGGVGPDYIDSGWGGGGGWGFAGASAGAHASAFASAHASASFRGHFHGGGHKGGGGCGCGGHGGGHK